MAREQGSFQKDPEVEGLWPNLKLFQAIFIKLFDWKEETENGLCQAKKGIFISLRKHFCTREAWSGQPREKSQWFLVWILIQIYQELSLEEIPCEIPFWPWKWAERVGKGFVFAGNYTLKSGKEVFLGLIWSVFEVIS